MKNKSAKSTTTTINTAAEFDAVLKALTPKVKAVSVKGKVALDKVDLAAALVWLTQVGPQVEALVSAADAAKAAAIESGAGAAFKGAAKIATGKVSKVKVNEVLLRKVAVAQMKRVGNLADLAALFKPFIQKTK
jgi:hypothetical protein